jgi:dephospho-CoA kinase
VDPCDVRNTGGHGLERNSEGSACRNGFERFQERLCPCAAAGHRAPALHSCGKNRFGKYQTLSKPYQVGVTGSIGSGKSLVCKIFAKLGAPIYDADSHAKELMTTDGILISGIKKEFGDLSYHTDGSLNRVYLAEHVFNDDKMLQRLNNLVHPRVGADYEQWALRHRAHPYVVKEAALLFEAGSFRLLDTVIVVHAPVDLRIKRVLQRDVHRSVEQIRAIVEKQMPDDEKLKRADHIVVNDESALLIPQVLKLHNEFSHRRVF